MNAPISALIGLGVLCAVGQVGDETLPPCCAAQANTPIEIKQAVDEPTQAADEARAADDNVGDVDPVHALLGELEHAAADLRAFTADVYYMHEEDLLGRREIRTGEIIYRVDTDGSKSFAVLFNRHVVGDRGRDQAKHYIFADRWLVEVDHENRQFIKREIVPPGRELDPLKLGEGPIPLPIGQPRDEVLARFDVTMIETVPEQGPLSRLNDVDGLRLVPKAGTPEARDYQHVDLYYDRASRLPVGIETFEANDDRKIVRLSGLEHNPQLTDEQLGRLSVAEPDARTWAIDVRPWRGGN